MMRVAMFATLNLAVFAAGLAAEPADKPKADKLRVVLWTGGGAHEYDAILMNHCYQRCAGVLTEPQKEKLLKLVRGGTVAKDGRYEATTLPNPA